MLSRPGSLSDLKMSFFKVHVVGIKGSQTLRSLNKINFCRRLPSIEDPSCQNEDPKHKTNLKGPFV